MIFNLLAYMVIVAHGNLAVGYTLITSYSPLIYQTELYSTSKIEVFDGMNLFEDRVSLETFSGHVSLEKSGADKSTVFLQAASVSQLTFAEVSTSPHSASVIQTSTIKPDSTENFPDISIVTSDSFSPTSSSSPLFSYLTDFTTTFKPKSASSSESHSSSFSKSAGSSESHSSRSSTKQEAAAADSVVASASSATSSTEDLSLSSTSTNTANSDDTSSYVLLLADQESVLKEHNKYRLLHDALPLVYNSSLENYALIYASGYNCSGILTHSYHGYGENLALATNLSPAGAVDLWYDETALFNYSDPQFTEETGHLTQLIWKATKLVGCSLKYCGGYFNTSYVVCEYYPPGNVVGANNQYFKNNISPES